MSHEEEAIAHDYIDQWRTYLRELDSPLFRPTPDLTQRQPVSADELNELKALLDYERQLHQQ